MDSPRDVPARRSQATGTGRRAFLGTVAGSLVALAGCLSSGSGDDASFDDWLEGANGYDGMADRTGTDETTVQVGAGGGLAFAPAAIEVDVGTTVVWEWTGRGSSHNVVERDGAFESEYYGAEGETFSHTFEEAGEFAYFCTPHRGQGMRGGVAVR